MDMSHRNDPSSPPLESVLQYSKQETLSVKQNNESNICKSHYFMPANEYQPCKILKSEETVNKGQHHNDEATNNVNPHLDFPVNSHVSSRNNLKEC
jgi:hypothetical protein